MAPVRLHWALPALLVALLGLLWHRRQRRGRPGPPDSRPPLQAKPLPPEGPPVTCGPATPAAAIAAAATPIPDAALKSGAEEASALTGGWAPQTVREELANTLRSEYFNKFVCEEREESNLIGGGRQVSQTFCEELANSPRSEDFNKLVCENWEEGVFAEGESQLPQTVRGKLCPSQQSEDFNKFVQEEGPVKEFRIQREPDSEGDNFEKSEQRQANFQEEVVENCIVDIGNSQSSEITSHTESGNKDIKLKVYTLSEGLNSLSQNVESHTKHIGKRKENHSPKKGEEVEETCGTTRVRHSEGSGVYQVEQEEAVSSSEQVQVEAVCRPQEAKEVEACQLTPVGKVEAVSNPEQATQVEVSSLNKSEPAVEIHQSKQSSSEAENRGKESLEGKASSSKRSKGQEVVSSSENRKEVVRSQKNSEEIVTNLKRTEQIVRSNEDSHEGSRSTKNSEVIVRSTKKVKEVEEGCQINQVQLVTSSKKKKPSNKVTNLVHTGQREAASSPKEVKQTEEIEKSTVAEQSDICSLNSGKGRHSEHTKQEETTNSSKQEEQVEFSSSSQTEVKCQKASEETNPDKVFEEGCSMQEKKTHTKESSLENSNHQQADKVEVSSHMQAEHEGRHNQETEQAEEVERILELVEKTESNQSQTQANQEEDIGCQQAQLAEEVGSLEGTQLAEEAENSLEGEAEEVQSQQPCEETKVDSSDKVEEVEVEVLSYQQAEGKSVSSHHQAKTAVVVSSRQSEEVEVNSQQTEEEIANIHQTKEPEIVSSQQAETATVSNCQQSEEFEISNQAEEVFSSHQSKDTEEDPIHSQSEEANIVSNLHHESEETEVISSQPSNKTEVVSSHLSEEGSGDQEVKGVHSTTQTELASAGTSISHRGGMAEGASGEPGSPSRAAMASAGPGVVRAMSGERDSANHSPAEGMLGSSRLCRCSDVQSEDSSDSGKGCSDAPTPASRTPASGSSEVGEAPGELAAELVTGAPLVYEFVLPQHLVGRLIGRHGCFVHQIKAQTNASILIKRHPETVRLKVCAVEGSQADVESALEMIRHKFPQKRYPNVTLEQVCFVPPVATVPMQPDCLRLQLVEGISNDVILSSLVTPSHFFLQQPTHPTYPALARLCACMNATYSESAAPLLPAMHAGMVAAAPVMGGWYRAEVVSVDEQEGSCQVRYVDFGGYEVQPCSALRQIRADFMTLPFQAAECYLANVVGPGEGGQWGTEALAAVEELTAGQVLQAQVCGYSEDGVPAVCLYALHGTCVVPVNRELVVRNLARWWEPQQQAE